MRRYPSPSLEPLWGVLASFAAFFLIGVWHGQTSEFIFFGFLQGLGVSAVHLYRIALARRLGRKRFKRLESSAFYAAIGRGMTFTWFTFTLIWFWSNWHQIGAIRGALGNGKMVSVWVFIFAASTVLLTIWETVRGGLLSVRWNGSPVLLSRYTRTAWNTALLLIALAVTVLLINRPRRSCTKRFSAALTFRI